MIYDSRDYYEKYAKSRGYGKPELRVDRTRMMPFVSFYLASIAVVVSVAGFIFVVWGK